MAYIDKGEIALVVAARCQECGAGFPQIRVDDSAGARRELDRQAWRNINGRIYCPECFRVRLGFPVAGNKATFEKPEGSR
jgi:hypothetical protein